MALVEYDLFRQKRDKVQTAIDRLRTFEPKEGYYVADSGGKDSTCVVKLCEMAGVKFDAHYNATTIDPPQLVHFIRQNHSKTKIEKPEYTMRELIVKKQMPPMRSMRYCCEHLKELRGQGRVVVTGVRWAESGNRKNNQGLVTFKTASKELNNAADLSGAEPNRTSKGGLILNTDNDESRRMVEMCYRTHKTLVNPIIDWTDEDVWEFIRLYAEALRGGDVRGLPLYVYRGISRLQRLCKAESRRHARKAGEGGRAMKTPDEIKKAVSLCILCESCTDCPYCESESETGCMSALNADVLAYIKQLEAEREGKSDE